MNKNLIKILSIIIVNSLLLSSFTTCDNVVLNNKITKDHLSKEKALVIWSLLGLSLGLFVYKIKTSLITTETNNQEKSEKSKPEQKIDKHSKRVNKEKALFSSQDRQKEKASSSMTKFKKAQRKARLRDARQVLSSDKVPTKKTPIKSEKKKKCSL